LIHNKNPQVINFIEGISKVMSKSPQDVLSQIKDEGIELIDLKFTDIFLIYIFQDFYKK